MFGYVHAIFQTGVRSSLINSPTKQRGRQIDSNECSCLFLFSPFTKKFIIISTRNARAGVSSTSDASQKVEQSKGTLGVTKYG